MPIASTSYAEVASSYRAALDWMGELGVELGVGRTQHYAKVIDYWKDAYKEASQQNSNKGFPDFVSSAFEISSFIEVYQAFRDEPLSRLSEIAKKLQRAVRGPIDSVDETQKSTEARNFIFEALMAARSHRPQYGIEAILDAESDTGFKVRSSKVWIECKRVTTQARIEENARKASRQLERVLDKKIGAGNRAIVALDVTKIINPDGGILPRRDDAELSASVDTMMDVFISKRSSIWQRAYQSRNKKIIGTILRFSLMAVSEQRRLLVYAAQWGLNPRLGISVGDGQLLRSVAETMKQP